MKKDNYLTPLIAMLLAVFALSSFFGDFDDTNKKSRALKYTLWALGLTSFVVAIVMSILYLRAA